jgi:hypothetical protein
MVSGAAPEGPPTKQVSRNKSASSHPDTSDHRPLIWKPPSAGTARPDGRVELAVMSPGSANNSRLVSAPR